MSHVPMNPFQLLAHLEDDHEIEGTELDVAEAMESIDLRRYHDALHRG